MMIKNVTIREYVEYADGFYLYRACGKGTSGTVNGYGEPSSYEVVSVSASEPELFPYASDQFNLSGSIFRYVPLRVMDTLALLHGGVIYTEPVEASSYGESLPEKVYLSLIPA